MALPKKSGGARRTLRERARKAADVKERERQKSRHDTRARLMQLVDRAYGFVLTRPSTQNRELAARLGISEPEAFAVRHAFKVRVQMQMDHIIKRHAAGHSFRPEDLARSLAVDVSTAEMLLRLAAQKIEARERKKRK
jgi:hypothetical protein